MSWVSEANSFQGELIQVFRHLHQYPELSGREYKTTEFIAQKLGEIGLQVHTFDSMTGVVGYLPGPSDAPTIAIRADMDALPIQEDSCTGFPSQISGLMHACGHDLHMTVCLGAAKVFMQHQGQLPFGIKFIFQPAEETNQGAQALINFGVLEDPKVDFLIGIHANPELAAGEIGLACGAVMAAESNFEIEIKGKSSHGSQPQLGQDALLAAANTVLSLQSIISRSLNPLDTAVLSVCTFNAGNAKNIIADKAALSGTVRFFQREIEELIKIRLEGIVKSSANAYGCESIVNFYSEQPPLLNEPPILEFLRPALIEEFGKQNIRAVAPSLASEDFSYFLQKVKGIFLWLGVAAADKGYPLHNQAFYVDPKAIISGCAALCTVAYSAGTNISILMAE